VDGHDAAERCAVEVLPGGVPADQKFMVDRLENKVKTTVENKRSTQEVYARCQREVCLATNMFSSARP
jgi:hypothetical protein